MSKISDCITNCWHLFKKSSSSHNLRITKTFVKFLPFSVSFFLLVSCNIPNNNFEKYKAINQDIQKKYAPDKRVAIYDISLTPYQNFLVLKGESDQPKAVEELKQELINIDVQIIDSIILLPNASVGELKYGVINNSVANIRSKPKHSAELATQALLGTGVKVLKREGSFYLVQVPDGYISWVDQGGVVLMNENDYIDWNNAKKVIYTKTVGSVYQEENDNFSVLSDIVLGAQIKYLNQGSDFFKIEYPDNRIGYIKKREAQLYDSWIQNVEPSGELLEKYARDLLGSPYLWGGTSTKGMDCSGFTKTVYLLNGFVIPRDASQQIHAGKVVDEHLNFDDLEKGDLMFFGTKASDHNEQRVTHVGMWLGNGKGEFIHSASKVRLSSINPESKYYDEPNKNRYLGSKRYLGIPDKLITNLKTDKILTDIKP